VIRGIEYVKGDGQRMTEAQIKWGAQMSAAIYDAKGLLWSDWPYFRGAQTVLQHNWIAPTSCALDLDQFNAMIDGGRTWLKLWQLGSSPTPPNPPQPEGPRILMPGVDIELAKAWFGRVVVNGRTFELTDPLGPAATLWFERGKQTGNFAALDRVDEFLDGRSYLRFKDGLMLWRPNRSASLAILKG
jgi:hypothetical protein